MIDFGGRLPLNLGQVVATPGAIEALKAATTNPLILLIRHASGDWGTVCDEDWEANDDAVKRGYRVLSSYELSTGEKIWIITEADRSVTTLLLPSEY